MYTETVCFDLDSIGSLLQNIVPGTPKKCFLNNQVSIPYWVASQGNLCTIIGVYAQHMCLDDILGLCYACFDNNLIQTPIHQCEKL